MHCFWVKSILIQVHHVAIIEGALYTECPKIKVLSCFGSKNAIKDSYRYECVVKGPNIILLPLILTKKSLCTTNC